FAFCGLRSACHLPDRIDRQRAAAMCRDIPAAAVRVEVLVEAHTQLGQPSVLAGYGNVVFRPAGIRRHEGLNDVVCTHAQGPFGRLESGRNMHGGEGLVGGAEIGERIEACAAAMRIPFVAREPERRISYAGDLARYLRDGLVIVAMLGIATPL